MLRVLLRNGLDEAVERRFAACVPPDGGPVDAIVGDALCTFAGNRAAAPSSAAAAPEAVTAGTSPAACSSSSGVAAGSTSAAGAIRAGFLCAPTASGAGLVLTLQGADASPVDGGRAYAVLGFVLHGRATLRKIAALAPLVAGESSTAKPATLRVVGTVEKAAGLGAGIAEAAATAVATSGPGALLSALGGAGEGGAAEEPSIPHPWMLLTNAPAAALAGRAAEPFLLEADRSAHTAAAEELEVAELELDCRELEVSALKLLTFSRKRQTGVDAVQDRLTALEERLKALGPGTMPAAEEGSASSSTGGDAKEPAASVGLDETLSGQRWWQEQRLGRLLRVLSKLH